MKKKLLIVLIFIAGSIQAQTLAEFSSLAKANDTTAQMKMLDKWEKKGSKDPDFYIAAFNFYALRAKSEVLALQSEPDETSAFELKDENDSIAGYLGSTKGYNPDDVKKAINYITKGIAKFPDRLDMRFGKIYFLGATYNYPEFTNNIISVIDYSEKIKNKWFWSGGKPLDDSKEFMLDAIQDYILQLYNTGDDKLLKNIERISEQALKYYPDHVKSMSNLSIVYVLNNEYKKALNILLKAEKQAPDDMVVKGNIANAYVGLNDKSTALKYYNIIIQKGSDKEAEFAKTQIKKNNL